LAGYALIVKTHFWDQYVQRQFDRLRGHCRDADIYIQVDDSNGRVEGIDHDKIMRFTIEQTAEMGLPSDANIGPVLWYNGDYPMYAFYEAYPQYASYLFLEYDVTTNVDLDRMVQSADADRVDFVAQFRDAPIDDWYWTERHQTLYAPEQMKETLFCLCYVSRPALHFLYQKRLEMAALLAANQLPMWPFCEVFLGAELSAAGFRLRDLSAYGDTSDYDHWPPYRENDLASLPGNAFMHPVLDDARYVVSLLKHGPMKYFKPGNVVGRKLRRMPAHKYVPALSASIMRKIQETISTTLSGRAGASSSRRM
jgi:hypothetical protein